MRSKLWPLRLAVRTLPFHGENTGSIPVGVTTHILKMLKSSCKYFLNLLYDANEKTDIFVDKTNNISYALAECIKNIFLI